MDARPALCYLCGQPLSEPIGMDHLLCSSFMHPEFVRLTLRTFLRFPFMISVIKSYQVDEDYFVTALMPHARGSYAGDAIYKGALDRYRGGGKVGLVRKVLAEFDHRPSGLVLPGNQVMRRFAACL
jgi:hypothetical protein